MIKLINRARNKNQKEMFWKRIIYHIPYKTLLAQGYLVPIEYINNPLVEYKEIPVNKSRSDYDLDGYSQMIVGKEALAVQTVLMAEQKHKSVLVFCATTDQAKRLSSVTLNSACVFGDTPNKQREQIIKDFKNGKIKTVYNYGVLTTGFDFPELECIVLVRPLRSPVLYNQICGRLTRTAVGKTKGILYDLTGSSKVLGPIEEFELYHNGRLWDIKSAKHPTWNNRVLYRMLIQEKKYV
jgi:DNA repair protein RadD